MGNLSSMCMFRCGAHIGLLLWLEIYEKDWHLVAVYVKGLSFTNKIYQQAAYLLMTTDLTSTN